MEKQGTFEFTPFEPIPFLQQDFPPGRTLTEFEMAEIKKIVDFKMIAWIREISENYHKWKKNKKTDF